MANAPLPAAASATTVRVRDGEVDLTDGPFALTKEDLAGTSSSNAPTSTRPSHTPPASPRHGTDRSRSDRSGCYSNHRARRRGRRRTVSLLGNESHADDLAADNPVASVPGVPRRAPCGARDADRAGSRLPVGRGRGAGHVRVGSRHVATRRRPDKSRSVAHPCRTTQGYRPMSPRALPGRSRRRVGRTDTNRPRRREARLGTPCRSTTTIGCG